MAVVVKLQSTALHFHNTLALPMDTTENMLTAPYYPGNQTAVTHTYETLEQEVH
jgi:hypothetical protein